MRAHKCLRLFIQIFRVYGNTIVERVIFQKRIPDLRIKNAVNIFFGFLSVAVAKIRLFFYSVRYRYILWQIRIEAENHIFAGNLFIRLKRHTIHIGVNAAVRSAAAFDTELLAKEFFRGMLKHLLHGDGVFLHLPAVISRAVIFDGNKQISHITAAASELIKMIRAKSAATAATARMSLAVILTCFIFVLPFPPL